MNKASTQWHVRQFAARTGRAVEFISGAPASPDYIARRKGVAAFIGVVGTLSLFSTIFSESYFTDTLLDREQVCVETSDHETGWGNAQEADDLLEERGVDAPIEEIALAVGSLSTAAEVCAPDINGPLSPILDEDLLPINVSATPAT